MANFVSYSDAQAITGKIKQKFDNLAGAYITRGSSAFANLPATPTASMVGYVYNVTDSFTTDSRFAEGTGKAYPAGSNVVVVDNSTFAAVTPAGNENPTTEGWYELNSVTGKYVLSEDTEVNSEKTYYAKTTLIQYDVLSGFVDLSGVEDAIDDLANDFASAFDDTTAYSIGDVVVYENKLYRFTSDHAAGAWDANDVTATTVDQLILGVAISAGNYANTIVNASKTTVEGMMAPTFAAANAYSIGDVVIYNDVLYKFTTAHTAGDPWNSMEVTQTTVADLADDAEPDSLTSEQIADLIGLLD